MPVTPGLTRQIKDALVAMLQAVQYGGEPAFGSVLDNTHDAFEKTPVAVVIGDKIQSVPESIGGVMQRTANYVVVTHLPISSPSNVEQTQYDTIYDLADLVTNAVDSGYLSGFLSTQIPGFSAYLMNCSQGTIRTAQAKVGPILLATLNIKIVYSQFPE